MPDFVGRVAFVTAGATGIGFATAKKIVEGGGRVMLCARREETLVTARFMGNQVTRCYDVGVAGIHRILDQRDVLRSCRAIIVVAGMEGALPSVVGGLVNLPIIAVPTSVGYGASFGGLAALLGMLNSCAPNVAVVNIDNGFGAGYIASMINQGKAVS